MYHVVIIDDEPIIVEGISKLVPWEKYGCMVTACAYDGKEGLTIIREKKPDIIFSDISMPGLDGLKMIAALKSEFPDMQISILTGHRDFDYCQEAIRLGVCRFLLKPSKLEEMEEALAVMVEILKKKEVKELLKEMQLRIVDISEMVGFTDVAHFSRVFKKLEGISANEYRNTKL